MESKAGRGRGGRKAVSTSLPAGTGLVQSACLTAVPREGRSPPPPATFPAWPVTEWLWHISGGESESDSCSATLGSSVWTPGSVRDLFVEVSQPARLPAPPRASLGVTRTGIIQQAAEQIRAVCNLLCVHFFVLLLPLNGGKQTFWEGIKPYEFTECQAFKWQIETNFEFFWVLGDLYHGASQ